MFLSLSNNLLIQIRGQARVRRRRSHENAPSADLDRSQADLARRPRDRDVVAELELDESRSDLEPERLPLARVVLGRRPHLDEAQADPLERGHLGGCKKLHVQRDQLFVGHELH